MKTVLNCTQQPYSTSEARPGQEFESHYRASAEDSDGNEYSIRWEILEDFDGIDEADACDWDNPSEIYTYDGDRLNTADYTVNS